MALMTGRATFIRFRVVGPRVKSFNEEHISRLTNHAAGTSRIATADGVDCGWVAGGHVLDTDFTLEKNIVNDALTFGFRVDLDKIPGDLMQSYTAIELKALSKDNPSGFASAKQKREAKESARERLEQEAKDGRFRKRILIPVLWDSVCGEILFGSSSFTHLHRFSALFQKTFGVQLEVITAGRRAYELAEFTKSVDDAMPTKFVPDSTDSVSWIADESSRDWLGNEFLLWLWYYLHQIEDTITLSDGTEAAIMLSRSLVLHCPRGATGQDGFRHEGPSRLPEAKRAAQAGKLPRKAGITFVRHDQQFEFTLNAELFSVNAAKMPNMPEDITDARARIEERVTQIRFFIDSIDLIYKAFLGVRLTAKWGGASELIRDWLNPGKAEAKAA